MEITAAIVGLSALKTECTVTVYSDSQYLVLAMKQGWVSRWRANNWKRNRKEKAVNVDLWEQLLQLCDRHQISFSWVPGHSGITENERCDQLSLSAAQRSDLPPDPGYQEDAARSLEGSSQPTNQYLDANS